MSLLDIASILLDSAGPRDAASRTLSWLQRTHRARTIALWRQGVAAELVLEMSLEADDATIRGAQALWHARRADPGGERTSLKDARSALIPTQGVPDSWVYLDDVDVATLDLGRVSESAAVAVTALRRGSQAPGPPIPAHDLAREDLVATLRLHEWNIARVARVKGVTRKTIYDWLVRYEIPRERVPKS